MPLTDMKLSASDRREMTEPATIADDAPVYPWGLTVHLDDATLEKLGMSELPAIGDTMRLQAEVAVTSVAASADEGGSSRSVGLQITAMELGPPAGGDAASRLYGSDE